MAKIFVSYSRVDQDFALRLKQSLEDIGADVWLDLEDIEPGIKWSTAIQDALRQCDLMLLILSPESVASQNVEDEWQYYLDKRKPIIPIYWRECEPHFQLSRLQYIDFRQDVKEYGEAFNRLLLALRAKGVYLDKQPEPVRDTQSHRISNLIQGQKEANRKLWLGIGAIVGILALIFAVYTFVANGSNGADKTPTPTTSADNPTQTSSPEIPTGTLTAIEAFAGIVGAGTSALYESASAAEWANTPSKTDTPTDTSTPTPNYTETYEKERENFVATLTAESWTATPTPFDTPTATFTPSHTPTLTEREIAIRLAEAGVSANDEWTPYSEVINGVEMVLVPAGCFMMGSEDGPEDEKPVHEQCFSEPFWIDRYEVTNSQFEQVNGQVAKPSNWVGPNHPRENITWSEAQDFCEKRNSRLPSEAEWEYAARGPNNLRFPWGNEFMPNKVVYSIEQTAEVGSKVEGMSWVGALDMAGNVWEWVNDIYSYYEGNESRINPTDTERVVRGGSRYDRDYFNLRTSRRIPVKPTIAWNEGGFRCARDFE